MKKIFCFFVLVNLSDQLHAQNVGIGTTTPDSNAILELKSNTKGFLLPRTSTTTKLLISNVKGLMVFDTTTNSTWTNDGTQWVEMAGGGGGTGWSLTGNAGTTSANFLGTTDNTDLYFRRNNIWAGRISVLNTYLGFSAGEATTVGSGNTAFGAVSLQLNDVGYDNTALGLSALRYNNSGYGNTGIGSNVMFNNTVGYLNTATGYAALYSNTTGYRNTATGYGALSLNTSASDNTATGMYALYHNNGFNNTANGAYALYYNTIGSHNTAMGDESLTYSITDNNTAIGYTSLYSNGGTNNTAIGAYTDVGGGVVSNAAAFGYGALVSISNRMRMGNVLVTAVESFGAFTTPSDARFKTDIKENVKGLDFILKLRPVTYQYDKEKFVAFETAQMPEKRRAALVAAYGDGLKQKGITRSGFLAQEVVQAMKQSGYDFDGVIIPENEATQNYSLAYGNFTVPLVKAVQEQQVVIETLKKENDDMKKRLLEMEKRLLLLEKK
jgi:hypothetical protein